MALQVIIQMWTLYKNSMFNGNLITNSSCHGYLNHKKSQNYPKTVLALFI